MTTLLGLRSPGSTGTTLRTRFITGGGDIGDVVTLAAGSVTAPRAVELGDGSAVVWFSAGDRPPSGPLRLRGHLLGEHSFRASTFLFDISVASVDEELFIVTSGEETFPAYG